MTTRVTRHIAAPRERVYQALVDPDAVARWRFPQGMSCVVHEFAGVEGGTLRISTSTIRLADAPGGGTDLIATHEGLPSSVSPEDNESGWRQAIERLAALVE